MIPHSQIPYWPQLHHQLCTCFFAKPWAVPGHLGAYHDIWAVIIPQSFDGVIGVWCGAVLVGLMGLVVRHEAHRWSRTAVGMPKVALATINLHVEAY